VSTGAPLGAVQEFVSGPIPPELAEPSSANAASSSTLSPLAAAVGAVAETHGSGLHAPAAQPKVHSVSIGA
jgi:hypothetical protein